MRDDKHFCHDVRFCLDPDFSCRTQTLPIRIADSNSIATPPALKAEVDLRPEIQATLQTKASIGMLKSSV